MISVSASESNIIYVSEKVAMDDIVKRVGEIFLLHGQRADATKKWQSSSSCLR